MVFPGQLAQLPDRRIEKLGVGWEGDVLRLHRGVDGDAGQIAHAPPRAGRIPRR